MSVRTIGILGRITPKKSGSNSVGIGRIVCKGLRVLSKAGHQKLIFLFSSSSTALRVSVLNLPSMGPG